MPDNTVMVQLVNLVPGTISDGTAIWDIPAGYTAATEQKLSLIAQYSSAPAYGSMPFLYLNAPSSALKVYDLRGTVSSIHASDRYARD
jgi:hypothetical protein